MKKLLCETGYKWVVMLAILLGSIVISACGQPVKTLTSSFTTSEAFVSPMRVLTESSTLDVHRRFTASQSFPIAYEIAKGWHQDAKWYGIVPFTSIERAFAIPLGNTNPSWFFRFGVPEEDRELVVEVLDNKIVGVNETKIPDYIEPPLKELEQLHNDGWNLLDNVDVLERYIKIKDNLLAQFPHLLVDYRLAHPKGYSHPIWTLYNAQNLSEPLFVVNAITGEILLKNSD